MVDYILKLFLRETLSKIPLGAESAFRGISGGSGMFEQSLTVSACVFGGVQGFGRVGKVGVVNLAPLHTAKRSEDAEMAK